VFIIFVYYIHTTFLLVSDVFVLVQNQFYNVCFLNYDVMTQIYQRGMVVICHFVDPVGLSVRNCVRILLSGFYCQDSTVRILLSGF